MPLPLRAALAALAVSALPALAESPAAMSAAEREAFRAEVRAYLLENPEVLMEAIGILEDRRASEEAKADLTLLRENAEAIFESPDDWVGGNPEGDVTVVEFMDYRCGYCKRAFPEVRELIEADGNIRFVVKEFPILGEASNAASRYAIAVRLVAGDDAYGQVHDALMELRGEPGDAAFERLSTEFGIDHAAVVARMDSAEVTRVIEANHALATKLQINGTPTFVIGDVFLRGYVPLENMKAFVAEARKDG